MIEPHNDELMACCDARLTEACAVQLLLIAVRKPRAYAEAARAGWKSETGKGLSCPACTPAMLRR